MSGGRAWLILIATICGWEAWCLRRNPDELLSRALDRTRARHRAADIACRAGITIIALHLARATPPRLDPLAWISR